MFEKLKRKIKHKIAEHKEAKEAYKKARHEEHLRLQHLAMLKKMESKKERIAAAKRAGIRAEHKTQIAKETAKKTGYELKETAKKVKAKADPILKQMEIRAAQYAKRELVGRPIRRRRKKAKRSRKRGYR